LTLALPLGRGQVIAQDDRVVVVGVLGREQQRQRLVIRQGEQLVARVAGGELASIAALERPPSISPGVQPCPCRPAASGSAPARSPRL